MRNLTKNEEKMIEEYRSIQTQYAAEDEERFQQLLSKLSIIDDSDQTFVDFLFDYIYNSSSHSEQYLDYLKSHIYGSEK
jgi:hypothetical protein